MFDFNWFIEWDRQLYRVIGIVDQRVRSNGYLAVMAFSSACKTGLQINHPNFLQNAKPDLLNPENWF